MSEWWTYTLSDFLMFSPRTYYRLFELYNLEVWPAHLVAAVAGIAALILVWRGGVGASRAIAAMLAVAWVWVAWAFLFSHYDAINWAGRYFAAGFLAEALLIGAWGVVAGRLALGPIGHAVDRVGFAVFLFALIGYPLIAPAAGRPWTQAEVFGLAPDPTAIATLGLLLTSRNGAVWLLGVLPGLWCAVSAATLWAMVSSEALLPAAGLVVAIFAASRWVRVPHS